MPSAQQLEQLKIFSGTAKPALLRLAQTMIQRDFASGEVICREGDPGDSLFLVVKGAVSVQKKKPGSAETMVVARLKEEEIFGEMSFLEQAPYSASVVADEPTQLFILPRSVLESLLRSDPVAGLDQVLTLFTGLAVRLRQTTTELVTVFEVAQAIGQFTDLNQLVGRVRPMIQGGVGDQTQVWFYIWNPFNEEFDLMPGEGDSSVSISSTLDRSSRLLTKLTGSVYSVEDLSLAPDELNPLTFKSGSLLAVRIGQGSLPEGLILAYNSGVHYFTGGAKQLLEIIAGVMGPTLVSARAREEDQARQRLERSRQEEKGF